MKDKGNSNITIKPVTRQEVPVLLSLVKELAEYERLAHEVQVTEEIMAESLFEDRAAPGAVLVYYEDNPAGYCIYFHNFSSFLGRPGIYLEDIYIRPAYRRHGLGRAVFSHLARLAREHKYGRLDFAVLDWNESAIRFYEEIGARPLDDWKCYRITGQDLDALAGTE